MTAKPSLRAATPAPYPRAIAALLAAALAVLIDPIFRFRDYRDLLHMLPAISTTSVTPLVRVSGNDPKEIMKVLDAGAFGVIVPLVNNRQDALAAVAAGERRKEEAPPPPNAGV